MARKQLEKMYNPKDFEDRLYQYWEESGFFAPAGDPEKPSFSIVMPPPNITDRLHIGHALDNTLQDILTRWRRMQGRRTLWLPGTDHASIATEAKIVEAMRKEGISKEDLGRDGFLERAWAWKKQYGGLIVTQLRKFGSSCDWSRERFTMDEGCSEAVQKVFMQLYEKGLIYRGERMINWCPCCKTSISDVEVEYEDQQGSFWHLRYPLKDGSGYLNLATTRPETLLGDTAVAVNPDDERYQHLVGKTLILPLVGREIPIVADEYVEKDFGTGVVKITPAHDPNDFEVGLRHNLPVINVMTDDAHIVDDYPKYAGMDRYEARKAIVADLEAGGYLVKTEPYTHNVGTCQRCHTTVEPRVSLQWFVAMKELAKPAIDAVRSGEIRFVPERFDKQYFHWMENIRDWCISRQLWWGHRIPAFYCDGCGEMAVTRDAAPCCPKCGKPMRQDPDTLDTWFSSALWPFSTLGWPEETDDLKNFYPTSTLITGYDIITFWVSRMIFSGLAYTGKKPFSDVFIHGLVRDSQGRKMSKSLGNGVDPLQVVDEYGADALRFMLANGTSPGNDMRYDEEKVKAARNFANKLWNASRFILMNLSDEIERPELPETLLLEDKWLLSKYNNLVKTVGDNMEKYELGVASQNLYDFIWDVFCDWYIEVSKSRLQAGGERGLGAQKVLSFVMAGILKLLHPFMPFITEEIWQAVPNEGETVMLASYPVYDPALDFAAEEQSFERVMDAIKAIRNVRAEKNVPPSRKAHVYIETAFAETFEGCAAFFERLASASAVSIGSRFEVENAALAVTDSAKIYLPMGELVDLQKERERLQKEEENCRKEIAIIQKKLGNESFVAKAPEKVVAAEREKLARAEERLDKILETLQKL
ncbi:MAG: valine--tRNA ligase [Oscillospiraceae bacterium]|nr:valine--tRNA ligase [Oscillospiraceae bacterium]